MIIALCKLLNPGSRDISLAITDTQRAINWIGRYEHRFGEPISRPLEDTFKYDETETRIKKMTNISVLQKDVLDDMETFLREGTPERELFLAANCIEESMMWVLNEAIKPPVTEGIKEDDTVSFAETAKPDVKESQAAKVVAETAGNNGMMSFYTALMTLIVKGGKVTRAQWGPGINVYVLENPVAGYPKFLARTLPGGNRFIPWQPDQMDLFANDWILAK